MAPPELKLLEVSIREDGFTQPNVTWESEGQYEIVDGFHRNLVSRSSTPLRKRLRGYLPVVVEMKERNRSNQWIAEHLGMDEDEVLRLTQVSGLTSMFANKEFSRAWEVGADTQLLEAFMKAHKGRRR